MAGDVNALLAKSLRKFIFILENPQRRGGNQAHGGSCFCSRRTPPPSSPTPPSLPRPASTAYGTKCCVWLNTRSWDHLPALQLTPPLQLTVLLASLRISPSPLAPRAWACVLFYLTRLLAHSPACRALADRLPHTQTLNACSYALPHPENARFRCPPC